MLIHRHLTLDPRLIDNHLVRPHDERHLPVAAGGRLRGGACGLKLPESIHREEIVYHFSRPWQYSQLPHGRREGLDAIAKVNHWAEIFAALKEAADPSVDVAVDIHKPHPRIAMQMFAALEPLRPLFIEERMPVERVDVLDQIAQTTRAPITAGERWMGKGVFFDALRKGSLAVVQPDLAHAGGIYRQRLPQNPLCAGCRRLCGGIPSAGVGY